MSKDKCVCRNCHRAVEDKAAAQPETHRRVSSNCSLGCVGIGQREPETCRENQPVEDEDCGIGLLEIISTWRLKRGGKEGLHVPILQ